VVGLALEWWRRRLQEVDCQAETNNSRNNRQQIHSQLQKVKR